MDFRKYIDWNKLWCDELYPSLDEDLVDGNVLDLLISFKKNENIEMDQSECFVDFEIQTYNITFSETGGQNESDNQGWFRRYDLTFDNDFLLIDIDYEQG